MIAPRPPEPHSGGASNTAPRVSWRSTQRQVMLGHTCPASEGPGRLGRERVEGSFDRSTADATDRDVSLPWTGDKGQLTCADAD